MVSKLLEPACHGRRRRNDGPCLCRAIWGDWRCGHGCCCAFEHEGVSRDRDAAAAATTATAVSFIPQQGAASELVATAAAAAADCIEPGFVADTPRARIYKRFAAGGANETGR